MLLKFSERKYLSFFNLYLASKRSKNSKATKLIFSNKFLKKIGDKNVDNLVLKIFNLKFFPVDFVVFSFSKRNAIIYVLGKRN